MTSKIARKAGLSLFEKHLENYEPADPLYETYTDDHGKKKTRKRELPPGLSKRDLRILRKVKSRARRLDKGFVICGMRFGWTLFIGLIPIVGDISDATLNHILVVRKAKQAELPDWLVYRMILNNLTSLGVGLIPIVGSVIVASFKANTRNAALLEEYLRIRGEEFLKAEAKRVQDPAVMKPGAGRDEKEKKSGEKTGTISRLFRSSKSKSQSNTASADASATVEKTVSETPSVEPTASAVN